MSEPCVRGCLRPCRCDACKLSDSPEHDPVPTECREGLLCVRCAGRLERWLSSLLDDTLHLDSRKATNVAELIGKHQKISGSPALVRLDVAALTDKRTMRDDEDNPNAPLYVAGVVTSWARLFTEELGLTGEVEFMAQAVGVLQAWWSTLVEQLWIDEFYRDVEQIRRLLDRAHGVEKRQPIGFCLSVYPINGEMVSCDQPIYAQVSDRSVRCHRCGRIYEGPDKLRLTVYGESQRDESVTEEHASQGTVG